MRSWLEKIEDVDSSNDREGCRDIDTWQLTVLVLFEGPGVHVRRSIEHCKSLAEALHGALLYM